MTTPSNNLNPVPEQKDVKRLSVRSTAANQDNEEENPGGIKKLLTRINTKTSNQKRASNASIQASNSQNYLQSKQDKDEHLDIPKKNDNNKDKNKQDKKKKRKVSLRRQITLVKQNTILIEEQKSTRNSINIMHPQREPANLIVSRDSLKVIKNDTISKKYQSTVMNSKDLPQLGGKNKQKQASTFFTSQQDEKIEEENQSIISEDDEDEEYMDQYLEIEDPLKEFESDELFKKVLHISNLITSSTHTELENEEIVNYLKTLSGLQGKCDHLNKNLSKKLVDILEIRFQSKGEYMFKKGQKADYAYVVLYGQVIFLNLKQQSYLKGQEPMSPTPPKQGNQIAAQVQSALKNKINEQIQKNQDLTMNFPRRTKIDNGSYIMIEEEEKVFEMGVGNLIGEIAMMDPLKATRAFSGMAKTDCVFLLLNHDAFDILVKEKQKKINEGMTQFLFEFIPRMKDLFQFKKVQKNVHVLFKEVVEQRKKEIIKEGDMSDKLYILKSGQCAMYKSIEFKDELGITKVKHEKLMNIQMGAMCGENGLFNNSGNQYSIRTITPSTFFTITYNEFKREFKRLQPYLSDFFKQRNEFILEREQYIKNARKHEKKNFNSKIEQGDMNIFLQKDFKTQVNFADNQTKKKLQVFFLRKELQQLNKVKYDLDLEQENTRNRLNMTRKKGLTVNNWATENEAYENVKVIYTPQKALKDDFGQIRNQDFFKTLHLKGSTIKQNYIEGIKQSDIQQSIVQVVQGKHSHFDTPRGSEQNQQNLRDLMQMNMKRNRNSNFSLYKAVRGEARTQSQASLQNYTQGLCNNRIYKSIHVENLGQSKGSMMKSSQSVAQIPISPGFVDQKSPDKFFERRKTRQETQSVIRQI